MTAPWPSDPASQRAETQLELARQVRLEPLSANVHRRLADQQTDRRERWPWAVAGSAVAMLALIVTWASNPDEELGIDPPSPLVHHAPQLVRTQIDPAPVRATPTKGRPASARRAVPMPPPSTDVVAEASEPTLDAPVVANPVPAPTPKDESPVVATDPESAPAVDLASYRPRAIREFLRVDWERWEDRELPEAVARLVARRDAVGLLAVLDDPEGPPLQSDLQSLREELRAALRNP